MDSIWSACLRLGFRPTEAEVVSFVAKFPPQTLFGYIDATALAEGRAKEQQEKTRNTGSEDGEEAPAANSRSAIDTAEQHTDDW